MTQRTYLDFHILQTVPPSCINRDDNGSPKSAMFGGVARARVSSQAWKNAVRRDFQERLDTRDLGERTLIAAERVALRMGELDPELSKERARELSKAIFAAAKIAVGKGRKDEDAMKTGYLLFLSKAQIDRLARLGLESADGELDKRAVKAAFGEDRSIDLALFGRMVAEDPELNVDAACQVSHALSVHAAANEFDFFTAMDDNANREADGAGAGMLGTVEFTSATLYRYATIDVEELVASLGSREAAARAASAFAHSFVTSMPTGKQNTFANRTRPGLVLAQVRSDQPVNLVGAFETPIMSDAGVLASAAERLLAFASGEDAAYGTAPERAFALASEAAIGEDAAHALDSVAERLTLTGLVEAVGSAVRETRDR